MTKKEMAQTVWDNIKTRRSIRAFEDRALPWEDVRRIVEAGRFAPSGKDRQTFRFTVVQDKEKIKTLADRIAPHFSWTRGKNYNFYAPAALILVSNDSANENGLADSACALQTMFLMAHALGIGSCWVNQLKTICDEPDIRPLLDALRIPQNHTVWGMAALGYASRPEELRPTERTSEVIYIDE